MIAVINVVSYCVDKEFLHKISADQSQSIKIFSCDFVSFSCVTVSRGSADLCLYDCRYSRKVISIWSNHVIFFKSLVLSFSLYYYKIDCYHLLEYFHQLIIYWIKKLYILDCFSASGIYCCVKFYRGWYFNYGGRYLWCLLCWWLHGQGTWSWSPCSLWA